MTDRELLSAHLTGGAGAESAFAELVRHHAPHVHAACRRQLGDDAAAEDATQAVFLALWRRAPRLGREASLAGWLFLAARLAARDLQRAERRRTALAVTLFIPELPLRRTQESPAGPA